MPRPASLRRWLREHPTWADAVLALGVLALGMLPLLLGEERLDAGEVLPWLLPAVALLVLRRRLPWTVWGLATVLGCIGAAVGDGPTPAYLPAVIALYTVSSLSRTPRAVGATVVTAVAPAALVALTGPGDPSTRWSTACRCGAGWPACRASRSRAQRAVVEAAHERARQAESSREEEAQRRVVEERLRIARELHDVVAHHVAVINVQAGVAGHLLRTDPDGADAAIAHVREASQTVLREVPDLLGLLRTEGETLETAAAPRLDEVADLVAQARRSGLDVVVRTSGSPVALSPVVDLTAYRVLQEALTNAGRHGSGSVAVSIGHDHAGLTLEVRNASVGSTQAATDRHGLVGMRERVASVGGSLSAGPDAGGAWVVRATLPVRGGSAADGAAR